MAMGAFFLIIVFFKTHDLLMCLLFLLLFSFGKGDCESFQMIEPNVLSIQAGNFTLMASGWLMGHYHVGHG
jgi:hypothetical protein